MPGEWPARAMDFAAASFLRGGGVTELVSYSRVTSEFRAGAMGLATGFGTSVLREQVLAAIVSPMLLGREHYSRCCKVLPRMRPPAAWFWGRAGEGQVRPGRGPGLARDGPGQVRDGSGEVEHRRHRHLAPV